MPTITPLVSRPMDATLTVTRAAQVLGVHPNTIRAWSDAGRLRYYRINPRGDRRYRLSDLHRFLAGAAEGPAADAPPPPIASTSPHARGGRLVTRRAGSAELAMLRPPGRAQASDPGRRDVPDADPEAARGLGVMAGLGMLAASVAGAAVDPETLLGTATRTIREGSGLRHVSVWRVAEDRLDPVGVSGAAAARFRPVAPNAGIFGTALARPGTIAVGRASDQGGAVTGLVGRELACAIPGDVRPWGVLLASDVGGDRAATGELLLRAAEVLGSIVRAADAATRLDQRVHRAEALGRVAGDIGSRLDPDLVLARLVDHAMTMFGGDRAAVFLFDPDGSRRAVASRNLSSAYLAGLRPVTRTTLAGLAMAARRPLFAVDYRNDPRFVDSRAAVVQEGYDTICVAPLLDDAEGVGSLNVYHDRPHHWTDDELATMAALATQASVAIRTARTYAQLATWAAQLQSIQQLGTRLNRLSDVAAIGAAIATELNQLIDYHNVRVYRLVGDDLVPVAMRGQVGEYVDETPDQLRVKVGSGITGWVAAQRIAQNLPDAAADPRANTIPGTNEDLDESMLLAPMLFEDDVLGVLVLSKLGLHQFTDDDLRLLVIYASFAAQAMAHADATQLLERQVQGQRHLLQITESILTTLDTSAVLESVAERLAELVGCDNVAVELVDPATGGLAPVMAKGADAAVFMEPWLPGESGIATWVVEHNEPVLLHDQFDDPRVLPIHGGPVHGGLICLPLRGRMGAIGVLTLERVGEGRSFSEQEYELVKLFAAQVSIAVQNAETHGAIARQAETDDLTGLGNHRSFRNALQRAVAVGEPFSLMMVDLDRFKLVNDTFGHQAGNEFLQAIARSIVGASRDSDAVFRYGGDEFTVLLPRTDAAHVGPVADRLRQALAHTAGPASGIKAHGVRVDASAGVATYPADGATPDAILLAADRACFVAKRAGGGRVATASEGMALEGDFTLQVPTPIDDGQ
ncbi:MAG: GAF domain-containing protein [Chloroflexi bacterium]|nr:GAF domain-containing protein [Chloroflexota bacterium]